MSSACGYKQDLPPEGGYCPYQIDRVPLRSVIGGRGAVFLALGGLVVGHIWFYYAWKKKRRLRLEMRGSQFAMMPLLLAERDRLRLKQQKLNFEEEKHLMRFYPAWKPGTFFGENLYKTIPENQYITPNMYELLVHADDYECFSRQIVQHST